MRHERGHDREFALQQSPHDLLTLSDEDTLVVMVPLLPHCLVGRQLGRVEGIQFVNSEHSRSRLAAKVVGRGGSSRAPLQPAAAADVRPQHPALGVPERVCAFRLPKRLLQDNDCRRVLTNTATPPSPPAPRPPS